MGRGSAAHLPHLQRTDWGILRSLLRLRGLGPSLFHKCPWQCGSGPTARVEGSAGSGTPYDALRQGGGAVHEPRPWENPQL
ncbi:hypothetical protein NDU88_006569 [Pleurodeles waltl]|uniref:Uncharacterized protein n=1 Tax=Pleurodeles waltl TaxID=8319 RepID=A0AAV7VM99_PLEWA|nr:hypothetical protein NDU88_006569 [Pleurodeles waltl]